MNTTKYYQKKIYMDHNNTPAGRYKIWQEYKGKVVVAYTDRSDIYDFIDDEICGGRSERKKHTEAVRFAFKLLKEARGNI